MGHELAVEVFETPAGSEVTVGEIYVVNPYLLLRVLRGLPGRKAQLLRQHLGARRSPGWRHGRLALRAVRKISSSQGTERCDECAAVEFLAIGAHAVRRGAVTAGDRVLVVGAGPIGLGVALFAKAGGAEVAVFDRDRERVESAAALAGVSDIKAEDDSSRPLRAFTSGMGFDIVFDATGNRVRDGAGL